MIGQPLLPDQRNTIAAQRLQAVHRGNLSRSGRFKLGGKPYSAAQRRRLEDALSVAVNASLGLEPRQRLAFVARHVACQNHNRPPPEAPARTGKLSEQQRVELEALMAAVRLAVNECNTMRGLPLRNVAEHLFAQHIVLRNHLRYASTSSQQEPPASKSEIRCAGRRLGMRGGAARHPTMQFINLPEPPTLPEIKEAEERREAAERTDPVTIRAREAAKQAFAKYDKDLSGAIDSAELFACLMAMGEVPGVSLIEQQRYLSVEFAKADADGSGSVDYDEFVTFYVKVVRAQEAERAARAAFARFDTIGDHKIEKSELFQVLVDLGMATGDTKEEKERSLEEEFAKADADKSGYVDFDEFIAFYTMMRKRLWGAELQHMKRVLKAKGEQRRARSQTYVHDEPIFEMLRLGDVKLLSARWWLQHSGYDRYEKADRTGRKLSVWTPKRDALLLPCRQLLEAESPEAYVSVEALELLQSGFLTTLRLTRGAEKNGVGALPIVVASHCWASVGVADPHGVTQQALAGELARHMGAYEAWGYDDMGIFFDWSSIYQDTVDVPERSPTQAESAERALSQMALLYAHKQTTVYVVSPAHCEPPRLSRGWPCYEEALCRLFKESPQPTRYRLPHAAPANIWAKVVHVGVEDEVAALGTQRPPMAPSRFIQELSTKVFTREADRDKVLADYRRTLEIGFGGVERLAFARRGWADEELEELALVLKEVDCPHVRELDLSANDITAEGLKVIGALHALEILRLSDCSWLQSLPESLIELHMLHTIKLDGCIGLSALPATFANMASLRTLDVTHCLRLLNLNGDALKMLPSAVNVITERKEKTDKLSKSTPES